MSGHSSEKNVKVITKVSNLLEHVQPFATRWGMRYIYLNWFHLFLELWSALEASFFKYVRAIIVIMNQKFVIRVLPTLLAVTARPTSDSSILVPRQTF